MTLTLSYQCLSHFVSLMPLTHAVAADVIQLLPLSDSETPWTAAHQASLSFTVSQSLRQLMSIESVLLSNLPILCHPLLLCPQILPASGSFPMSQSVSTSAFYSPFRSYLCLLGSLTVNFVFSRMHSRFLFYSMELCVTPPGYLRKTSHLRVIHSWSLPLLTVSSSCTDVCQDFSLLKG